MKQILEFIIHEPIRTQLPRGFSGTLNSTNKTRVVENAVVLLRFDSKFSFFVWKDGESGGRAAAELISHPFMFHVPFQTCMLCFLLHVS